MTLTMQIKLLPNAAQAALLDTTMNEYISLVNAILDYAIAIDNMPMLSSKSVKAPLPSALRGQCCMDATSIYMKSLKLKGKFPVLRKPVAIWNNQNYSVEKQAVAFPLFVDGKTKKTAIPALVPEEALHKLGEYKLGTLRITKKGDKYIAQIAYQLPEPEASGTNVMGIDLGLKCPAVSVCSNGKTQFFGNGRQAKYIRRRYAKRRKVLGKAKRLSAIKKSRNKEQRWMTDQDHKISRAIINYALANNVGIIKLETLTGIRQATRISRKNNHSRHNWSFYRLTAFIVYKAKLVGIDVVFVNPAYTSQTCPHCRERNHAKDRNYTCSKCGYHTHRDRVGAVNILAA